MTSIKEGVDGVSIANDIRLQRAVYSGSFLLVEGADDATVLERFCAEDECSIFVCLGKKNALDAVDELGTWGFVGALGLADRDFDEILGYRDSRGDVVYTDDNDLDVMILSSEALDKVLGVFGNRKTMTENIEVDGKGVRESVFSSASVVGALRLVAQEQGWSLRFVDMKYKYVEKNSYLIDEVSTIGHVYGRSRAEVDVTEEEIRAAVQKRRAADIEVKELCRGHDCVRVLGRGLKKAFGTSRQFNDEQGARTLEGILRVGYEWQHFVLTDLYSAMRRWEVVSGFTLFREVE